jgi:hypothetical protein
LLRMDKGVTCCLQLFNLSHTPVRVLLPSHILSCQLISEKVLPFPKQCTFFNRNICYCCWDRVSLCDPVWPQTSDPPASGSRVLGLQACTTTPSSKNLRVDNLHTLQI